MPDNPNLTPEIAQAIFDSAQRLGVDPVDLASVVAYETAGTFSPSIRGGMNRDGSGRGSFVGLIQFSPENQRQYGVRRDQTVREQMKSVEDYLHDRGVRPGMGLLDIYSAINAGRVGLYDRADVNGTQRQHAERIARDFSPSVMGPMQQAYQQPVLNEFARQNEVARDVEGLFGAPVQQSPSILEGFDILSNVNWSGVPTPTAKPAQNVPTPTAKPAAPRDISPFGMGTPERASQRPGARDIIGQIDTINAAPVTPVERGLLGDLATAAPVAPVERGVLADLAAPAREFTGFGMNSPERASQREQQQEQGAPRGLLDGFGDLAGARSGIADVATSLGQSMGRAPEGYQAPRDVGILDFAGLSAPTAAPAAVPEVAAGPVLASATGRVGPGINPTGFASATISAPTRNDRASTREQEQEDQGINFGIDAVPTDRTTLGLLGQLGAPEAVVQRAQERERARQEEQAALQAPMQAPPQQAAPAMPAMAPARNISSMPTPQGPGTGPAVTVPGAVPEVAAAVNRYGLDPDPGPGRAYGYSPWGSGVSISYDTAPDRVRDAGTGPGLFGAFNDAFGVDLTPSPGFMTGPIAMGLDAAGGGGLFSLGNMLGGSRSLVDRMDVVDRATRDRIDGPRDEGSNRSGGLLGGFLSDPLGSAGRQARSELGTLGGLFGWGGDTRGTASAGTSGSSSSGGFLSGLGDILGGIFGGYEPATERDSRSGSMGGVGSASARGFY